MRILLLPSNEQKKTLQLQKKISGYLNINRLSLFGCLFLYLKLFSLAKNIGDQLKDCQKIPGFALVYGQS